MPANDDWTEQREWMRLTPAERFRVSQQLFDFYVRALLMGGRRAAP